MSADAHEAIEHLAGHRQRLRERFMAGDPGARSEEAVLELLLTYALPHQDVKPIARQLLADFGDLAGVLAAEPEKLCEVKGVKEYTVALLKAVGWITSRQQTTIAPCEAHGVTHAESIASAPAHDFLTLPLPGLLDFNASAVEQQPASATAIPDPLPASVSASLAPKHEKAPRKAQRQVTPRSGTELFGKAMLQEAIDLLPGLPDTDSLEEAKAYLRSNLRFNSQQTRQRNSSYIARRMFPNGIADGSLRRFTRQYAGRQELRDVCFYRFCQAEPIERAVIQDLLLPSIGSGRVSREQLKNYLAHKYPASRSIDEAALAISDALKAAGIARVDRKQMLFSYRDIPIASLAFILHSEFPEPGIYDLAKIEKNEAIQSMLWRPDRLMPSLYELRNRSILAKVSEIDAVRQFTTRWTLEEVVGRLIAKA